MLLCASSCRQEQARNVAAPQNQTAAPALESHALSPCPSEASSPAVSRWPTPDLPTAPRSDTAQRIAEPFLHAPAGMLAQEPPTSSLAAGLQQVTGRGSEASTAVREHAVPESRDGCREAASAEAESAVNAAGEGLVQRELSLFVSESGTLMSVVTMPQSVLQGLGHEQRQSASLGSSEAAEGEVMPGSDWLHGSADAIKAEAGHGKREDGGEERPHRLNLVHVDGNGNSVIDVKAL